MPVDLDALIHDTLQLNAAHAAISDTSSIVFDETYRKYCEQNRCGQYDTNWMGPPAIGPISELKERVLKYKQGLLFQTICTYQGTGLFDYKGMKEGMKVHEQIFRKILAMMKTRYSFKAVFPLNAGKKTEVAEAGGPAPGMRTCGPGSKTATGRISTSRIC